MIQLTLQAFTVKGCAVATANAERSCRTAQNGDIWLDGLQAPQTQDNLAFP